MRATISFDVDMEQVEGTMAVVACSEEHNLRAAADILSNYTVLDGSLLNALTEVLRLLDLSADQLRQYKSMVVNFEKARLEHSNPATPQIDQEDRNPEPSTVNNFADVRRVMEDMEGFDSFLSQLPTEDSVDLEVEEDEES